MGYLKSLLPIGYAAKQDEVVKQSNQNSLSTLSLIRLLFSRQDHLLTLAATWHRALLAMLPDVLLSSLESGQFFSLDLASLLNGLRQMSVTSYTSDLRHVRVSLDQSLVVFKLLSLAGALDRAPVRGIGTPDSDVAVVRTGEDVLVIRRPFGRENSIRVVSM